MWKKTPQFVNAVNRFSSSSILILFTFVCSINTAVAREVTDVFIDEANGRVSWMANGMAWYATVEKDTYFGATIPVINVDLATGNETLQQEMSNCYYRGTLADAGWTGIANTQAFINLCHGPGVFSGFVSNDSGVYTIEKDAGSATLVMLLDNPRMPLTTPNETNTGNNGGNGSGQLLKPDVQVARGSTPDKFPSVEIVVEPSFVSLFGSPGFVYRIASTLAFANFVYQQSGMKQMHLISINVLNEDLNHNGGQGAVRHQMLNLRRSIVQQGSGDVSVLMVGGDIDSTYLWGWGLDANACKLQIAVAEGDNLNTIEIGRSSAFVIDLPSLIQRGWIFAHEFGHIIGATKHINGDPLMDGWFQYINTLSQYVAGCDAKTQMFESCEDYDPKFKTVTQYYACE